jgi:predicted transposase/invertase (TIGR01784 family)
LKTDSVFFRLFQRLPELVFELAGWPAPDMAGYQFRSEEIKQTAFRLDGVLAPPAEATERPMVFVEVQYQPDDRFYSRFFAEIFLYLYLHPPAHPWQAVVIYPERRVERDAGQHYAALLTIPQVRRVYLEDFRQPAPSSLGLRLLQLLIGEPAQAITQAQALVQPATPAQRGTTAWAELVDLVETLLVYRLPKLSREEIRAMLNLVDVDLKQTRFYQEVFAEGRQEESTSLILRLLRRRFGALDAAQVARIQRLPLEQAESLAEALLDFQTPADLAAWLAGQESGDFF